jgi:hypothetical protein
VHSPNDAVAAPAPHVGRTVPAAPASYADEAQAVSWLRTERLLALVVTVVIAARIELLPQILLTLGDVLVIGLAPIWLPVTRRYVGARAVIFLGLAAVLFGALLTVFAATDHEVRRGQLVSMTVLMLAVLGGFGFLLWAREKIGVGAVVVAFGVGQLLGVSRDNALYASNPWRFGFSVAVTVLVLGLTHLWRRRGVELVAVVALTLVSALTGARSSFAILLLTAAILAWQLRPRVASGRSSAARGVLGLAVLAALVYNVGQVLILDGYLGAATQQRSEAQVNQSGSLILGGRPELTATIALMRDHPSGYGSGTIPNLHDIMVAKAGMSAINYDPNNGYVENYMFGNGYSLHSVVGELWALFGIVGVAFALLVLGLVLRRLGHAVTSSTASAIVLYLSLKTLWNFLFAPWYSALAILMLTLALVVVWRRPAPSAAEARQEPDVATADLRAPAP